jgi:hypothetical protein
MKTKFALIGILTFMKIFTNDLIANENRKCFGPQLTRHLV